MNIRNLEGFKVYILESLCSDDRKTGEDLKDILRQMSVDKKLSLSDFDYQYISISNKEEFLAALATIEIEVNSNNKWPIIQVECHGSIKGEGLVLSSRENVCWTDLFDSLRTINIASSNLLILNLSMCFGDTVIRYIDPQKRAPFRGVTFTQGEAYPEQLEKAWSIFYTGITEAFKEYGFSNLAHDSDLLYISQDFIFDYYFDLANQAPELFDQLRNKELAEMCKEEGLLYMDSKSYKKWVAHRHAQIKEKFRPIFCFDDLKPLHKSAYEEMREKGDIQ